MRYQRLILVAILLVLSLPPTKIFAIAAWPDTGQDKCYNNYVQITCPQSGQAFYGQDAQHQGIQPSYTKLDANGNDLPDTAGSWSMVRDNVTGLIWEVKTKEQNIHNVFDTYSWCDSNETEDACGDQTTQSFINTLNSSKFGNQNDWRLPTVEELGTLFNSDTIQQAINPKYFPNNVATYPDTNIVYSTYWSSTTVASDSSMVWVINYDSMGDFSKNSKIPNYFDCVMAVRGGKILPQDRFFNNNNGTITDIVTGLIWQQASAILNGGSTPDYMQWEIALSYVQEQNNEKFAGYSDWRLPCKNELISLLDFSQPVILINPLFIMNTFALSHYWTSTTDNFYTDHAWDVDFQGGISTNTKFNRHFVRMVRGDSEVRFTLSVGLSGNGHGIVISNPDGILCGSDCSEMYNPNTIVTLTATPDADSIFSGWSGDCSGTGSCIVQLNFHKYVKANFVEPVMSPVLYLLQSSSE